MFEALKSIIEPQLDQRQANEQLRYLLDTLSDKFDDLSRKSIADDEEIQGAENTAPSLPEEVENITDGDKREEEVEE